MQHSAEITIHMDWTINNLFACVCYLKMKEMSRNKQLISTTFAAEYNQQDVQPFNVDEVNVYKWKHTWKWVC